MEPNLFDNATSELSQDGFLTWLLLWANNEHKTANPALNATAKDFVEMLVGEESPLDVQKVEVNRQWNNIDIVATVNDKFMVVIEDKTFTKEHSEQLKKYKGIVTNHCKENQLKPCFNYLKTGNESLKSLREIESKGYHVITRKPVLDILNKRDVDNDIFNDFKDHLTKIENETLNYANFQQSILAAEGFCLKLQPFVEDSDWESNKRYGFVGFTTTKNVWIENETTTCGFWNQIEIHIGKKVLLTVKMELYKSDRNTIFNDLKTIAEKHGVLLNMPENPHDGLTSTVAVVPYGFSFDSDGNFDFQALADTLKKLDSIVQEYEKSKQGIK